MRPENKLEAVTSLLLIVDAHAMTIERQENVFPSLREPPNSTLTGYGNWRPLCVGNLSFAVLKEIVLEK